MGSRGPVPKRAEARAGHRTKAEQPDRVAVDGMVAPPSPDDDWHPRALEWFKSLAKSGQSRWFEPSDWEYARILATVLSDQLRAARPSSEMLKAVLSGMSLLGTTEADRRRMRIEVDRKPAEPDRDAAEVAALKQLHIVAGS